MFPRSGWLLGTCQGSQWRSGALSVVFGGRRTTGRDENNGFSARARSPTSDERDLDAIAIDISNLPPPIHTKHAR